jgi:divalent metal cation (Fe/Co/Zn/Cd) transporter
MGWSKSTRIKVMLVIDVMFFLLELGVGFAVHSLALMADAFHMVSGSTCDRVTKFFYLRFPLLPTAQRHHLAACWPVGRIGGEEGNYG